MTTISNQLYITTSPVQHDLAAGLPEVPARFGWTCELCAVKHDPMFGAEIAHMMMMNHAKTREHKINANRRPGFSGRTQGRIGR